MALAAIAREVIAIDASAEMLRHATKLPNIHYQVGFAEQLEGLAGAATGNASLPAAGAQVFDLISVGSALHWFDRERFYAQCRKVLRPSGLLAVYNDHFTTHMEGSVECKRWMRTRFAKRFPPPQRGMRDIDELQAAASGFAVCERSSFSHRVPFSRPELIAYLLTRSNILAVLASKNASEKASGKQEQQTVVQWLQRELAPLIPNGVTKWFIFKCNLWLLRQS